MHLGYRTLISSARSLRRARTVSLDRAVGATLEQLELRRLYAVTANAGGGLLTVMGDSNANAIVVSRDAGGNLLVTNGGAAVAITGSPANVGTIQQINIFGFGGNDSLALDESAGALPKASMSGGNGNDTLIGGAGADTLNGDSGNDVLRGQGGNDTLKGGGDNDTLVGGAGTDAAFGQSGNDRLVWNPGEGSDLNEGGDGTDTIEVHGAAASEAFTVLGVGNRVLFTRIIPTEFTLDIGTSEKMILNTGDGDDTFAGGNGLAGLMSFTVNGGAGDDTLQGTDGADRLSGGDGIDFVDGNAGADVALLGAGDDFFVWDPGDGSDVVEGQGGADRMIFNGNANNERFDLSEQRGRLRLFRDAGNITMDVNDVEAIDIRALGGADSVTIHDLRHTDVTGIDLSLAESLGGDGQGDSVIIEGTSRTDVVHISSGGGDVVVEGLATTVAITNQDARDTLRVNAGSGNDVLDGSGLEAGIMLLTLDGGNGNDFLVGSQGNDTLLGGNGQDVLIGGPGADALDGGNGDDIRVQ